MFQQLSIQNSGQLDSPDVQMGLETFTCFSRLPKELRLQVWRGTLPQPRRFILKGSDPHNFCGFISMNNPGILTHPAALHVNHESRTEVLGYLTGFFIVSLAPRFENYDQRKRFVTFNPHLDSVYLGFKLWKWERSVPLDLDKDIISSTPNSSISFSRTIRFLEIECDFWNNHHEGLIFGNRNVYSTDVYRGILPWFPKLQQLRLIMMDNGYPPTNSAMMRHSKDLYQRVSTGFLELKRKDPKYEIPDLFIYDSNGQETWSPNHHLHDSLVVLREDNKSG
jgi:hypothetical protein